MKLTVFPPLCLLALTLVLSSCRGGMTETPAMNYPGKPITVLIPYTAGGGTDLVVRSMERRVLDTLGQQLIILNKPGAGGIICWDELCGSTPDGYTLGAVGTDTLIQSCYGTSTYDYSSALEPILQIGTLQSVLTVRAEEPWQNLQDLIRYAKEHPGSIRYGHSGLGSITHITGELICKESGITMTQVPFSGAGETMPALLGGHIQMVIGSPVAVLDHVRAGKLRILATTGKKRLIQPEYQAIPTLQEQGVNVVMESWTGLAAHKPLPAPIRQKLGEGLKKVVSDPAYKEQMAKSGITVDPLGPDEFMEKWLSERDRIRKIITETGILEIIKAKKK